MKMADQPIRVINFGPQSIEPCNNSEVAELIEVCDDSVRQITACGSAHKRNWQQPDLIIIRTIHNRLDTMVEDFEKKPEQYVPNADNIDIEIPTPPICQLPENFGASIISRQIARLRSQLRNGSSSEQTSGFHRSELKYVIRPILEKLDEYLQREEATQADNNAEPDWFPDVRDQEASETTPGHPDNQVV